MEHISYKVRINKADTEISRVFSFSVSLFASGSREFPFQPAAAIVLHLKPFRRADIMHAWGRNSEYERVVTMTSDISGS